MKLSISNIAWDNANDDNIYQYLKQKGYTGLEIAPTKIIPGCPYEHLDKIGNFQSNLLNNYELEISSIQSIWFGKTGNIFRLNDVDDFIEYTKKAILFAEKIKCQNIVFGCPKNRNVPEGCHPSDADQFFYEITNFAEKHNTIIALEPNPVIYQTNFINTTKEAFDFVKRFNRKGLKVNVDLGTIIYNNEDISPLKENIHYINHIHISEPNLEKIKIRKLHTELNLLLKEVGYKNYVSIEMKALPANEVKEVIDYISEVFLQ